MKSLTRIVLLLLIISCGNKKDHAPNENSLKENTSTTIADQTTTALNFINAYVKNCNRMQNATDLFTWVDSTQLTTIQFKIELKKLLAEADPESGLESDPIFNAQDYPEDGFEIEKFENKNNLVIVKGKSMPDLVVTILLKKEKNSWKINGCGAVNPHGR